MRNVFALLGNSRIHAAKQLWHPPCNQGGMVSERSHPIEAASRRDTGVDALRGLFLIIMTAVHVPTPLSHLLQEPFGFFSMAEGFVFLSACLSGKSYGNIYRLKGWNAMANRVWIRTRKIYLLHLSLVLTLAMVAWLTRIPSLMNHFHIFFQHPIESLLLMPLLLHEPPLLDILPMYVVFMGITPGILAGAKRWGWMPVMILSVIAWIRAQAWFASHAVFSLGSPFCLGSFNLPAWQLLWTCGLCGGQISASPAAGRARSVTALGVVAAGVALLGLSVRHGFWPATWLNPALYLWMDKWTLGPLRLLNFAAWTAVLFIWKPRFPDTLSRPAALLGRHSLVIFSIHIVFAVFATIIIQSLHLTPNAQIKVGLMVIAGLFACAAWRDSAKQKRHPPPKTIEPPTVEWIHPLNRPSV